MDRCSFDGLGILEDRGPRILHQIQKSDEPIQGCRTRRDASACITRQRTLFTPQFIRPFVCSALERPPRAGNCPACPHRPISATKINGSDQSKRGWNLSAWKAIKASWGFSPCSAPPPYPVRRDAPRGGAETQRCPESFWLQSWFLCRPLGCLTMESHLTYR